MLHPDILRSILESPEDDAPRLVAADWLDEQGDTRSTQHAALIRGMVADKIAPARFRVIKGRRTGSLYWECYSLIGSDRWPGDTSSPDGCNWANAMRDVLGDPWWKPDDNSWVEFRRGFPSAVILPTASFLEHAATLFVAAPIEAVTLSDKEPYRAERRFWWSLSLVNERDSIPEELLDHHEPGDAGPHPTVELASKTMSNLCVRYGRFRVGLPALVSA